MGGGDIDFEDHDWSSRHMRGFAAQKDNRDMEMYYIALRKNRVHVYAYQCVCTLACVYACWCACIRQNVCLIDTLWLDFDENSAQGLNT